MRTRTITLLPALAGLALTCGCVTGGGPDGGGQVGGCPDGGYAGAAARIRPKHVVFVGFDGLAAYTLKDAETPTFDRLMEEGSWTLSSRSILPSSSACNWRSIFTCSASEQHGFNNWGSKEPAFPPSALAENGKYPDLFHMLRKARPEAEVGLIYEWGGIAFVASTGACSYAASMSAAKTVSAACDYIRTKKPAFLAVICDRPDNLGHGKGWGSPEYIDGVSQLDGELAKILGAIDEAGMRDETVVVVSTDHGGHGKGHGAAALTDMECPLLIAGKGVRKGHHLAFGGTVYDTGATLAALLGIVPPQAWIGRPLDEAFEK